MSSHSLPQQVKARLEHARALMAKEQIDVWLLPSSDPHQSEYLPEHWQGRQWMSGFNGSVGTLIVTPAFAGVWVDSRYWAQAEHELSGSGIELVKMRHGEPGPLEWLVDHTCPGQVIAVDGNVMAYATAKTLAARLQDRSATLKTDRDLLSTLWPARPALPKSVVYEHTLPYSSSPRSDRLREVRQAMREQSADWHLVSALDDIAWLLNLRGSDVPYNPVFLAHVMIEPSGVTLFIDPLRVPTNIVTALNHDNIQLKPYDEILSYLEGLPADANLLVDPLRVAVGLIDKVADRVNVIEAYSAITLLKSRKTAVDVDNIRQTMEQDGVALCEFFAWLDSALESEQVTEWTIDRKLAEFRERRQGFVSLSFGAIVAFNANGAMPHYRPSETSHALIEGDGLLLIDSGGQYLGGTTDITRMVAIGKPTSEQKHDCTRVLKGLIALTQAKFPVGIPAPLLDAIARRPLWADGVNYGHNTGHGVGFFLNVHEGPHSIGYQVTPSPYNAMQPGMVTSIEPGTYRPDKWGVRIENLAINRAWSETEFGSFLKFETLTLCPIDMRCIDHDLLSSDEKQWLNFYHGEVKRRLAPLLSGHGLEWLIKNTLSL